MCHPVAGKNRDSQVGIAERQIDYDKIEGALGIEADPPDLVQRGAIRSKGCRLVAAIGIAQQNEVAGDGCACAAAAAGAVAAVCNQNVLHSVAVHVCDIGLTWRTGNRYAEIQRRWRAECGAILRGYDVKTMTGCDEECPCRAHSDRDRFHKREPTGKCGGALLR